MKILITMIAALMLSTQASASELIIDCKTKIEMPDDPSIMPVELHFEVHNKEGNLIGRVNKGPSTEITVHEGELRKDISPEMMDLTTVETIIVHAKLVESDPEMRDFFSSGVDLNEVHFVKAYQFGERTNMGFSAVSLVYDKDHNFLGKFLGGFILSKCL